MDPVFIVSTMLLVRIWDLREVGFVTQGHRARSYRAGPEPRACVVSFVYSWKSSTHRQAPAHACFLFSPHGVLKIELLASPLKISDFT